MNILITGPPGIGKTSILNRVKDKIKSEGYSVGGIYSPEIRKGIERTGFNIVDLSDGRVGILASITGEGPNVGKYKVNLKDLDQIGVNALDNAVKDADFIFIDEIAPMELKSNKFSKSVESALHSDKTVITVIHQRSRHKFILDVKNRDDVTMFQVSRDNRESLDVEILQTLGLILDSF